jgi:hypothetical protein
VRETLDRYGLVGLFGLLTGRSMVSASMILFDTADAEQVETTRNAVREMYDRAAEWGCTGYRAHVSLVDHVAAKFDFNDHALGKTYARLKQAFDPAGPFARQPRHLARRPVITRWLTGHACRRNSGPAPELLPPVGLTRLRTKNKRTMFCMKERSARRIVGDITTGAPPGRPR